MGKECHWEKFGYDWWYVCENHKMFTTEKIPIKKVEKPKPEPKGNFWGWLWCAVKCSNYTKAPNYDWFNDKCQCEGEWRSPMWRR